MGLQRSTNKKKFADTLYRSKLPKHLPRVLSAYRVR